MWDLTTHKIIISKDVVFDESSLTKSDFVENNLEQEQVPQYQEVELETRPSTEEKEQEDVFEEEDADLENIQETIKIPQPSLRRYTQIKKPSRRYDDFISSVALISNNGELSCYQETMSNAK